MCAGSIHHLTHHPPTDKLLTPQRSIDKEPV
jgi:hypothetical protein